MNRFTNMRVVSRGGMATIYRADDSETGGTVALKEVLESPGFSEGIRRQLQKRLEREAKTLARLTHPNIVKYFGTAQQDGHIYIVTEFLTGTTLEQEIVSGRIVGQRERIIGVFAQVCEGMEFARAKGIIHRDIKPANIFLCGDRVKIIDFGIARIEDEISMTLPEQILGTPHYMSPEQTLGAHQVDHRGDIFSMGVCLYHAATGELPFNGKGRTEVTTAIRMQPMPKGRLWPDIEPVVDKALQKDPKGRWQSFAEFDAALRQSSGGAPASVSVPAPERIERPIPVGASAPEAPFLPQPMPDATYSPPVGLPQPIEGSNGWRYILAGAMIPFALIIMTAGAFGALVGMLILAAAVAIAVTTALRAPGMLQEPMHPSPGLRDGPLSPGFPPLVPTPPAAALPRQAPDGRRVCYSVNGVSMVSRPSDTGTFTLGRSESAHVNIPGDSRVSGSHATLTPRSDGSVAFADHSSNGSFVGGSRVSSVVLRPGDELRLGSTVFRLDSVT